MLMVCYLESDKDNGISSIYRSGNRLVRLR